MKPRWILVSGLVLLCTSAEAVPCRDDSSRNKEDRGALSIQLPPAHPEGRSYGALPLFSEGLPPGLATRDGLPPGLLERDDLPPALRESDGLPPGLRDRFDGINGRGRDWHMRIAAPASEADPLDASIPVPEPTALVVFALGLLLARTAVRRRRI